MPLRTIVAMPVVRSMRPTSPKPPEPASVKNTPLEGVNAKLVMFTGLPLALMIDLTVPGAPNGLIGTDDSAPVIPLAHTTFLFGSTARWYAATLGVAVVNVLCWD